MRELALPAAALLLAGAAVFAGGRMVESRHTGPVEFDQPGPDELATSQDVVASTSADDVSATAASTEIAPAAPQPLMDRRAPAEASSSPEIDSGAEALAAVPSEIHPPSRLVAPGVIAPPELAGEALQRDAPREPLSKLSLALPPVPEVNNKWAGTPFFRPVAIESAVFESGGRRIAIAGVKSVPPDESCSHGGLAWRCGARARTAFRLWLRGRALVCQLPDEEQEVTHARCRLAKQDAGAWLVSNGWALAAPDGPYVQAEEKARAAKLGIFGAPPDTSSISAIPDAPVGTASESQPVMMEEGAEPPPPADPRIAFPPAPE